jgi:co-chaperonin GroES (HSP10)
MSIDIKKLILMGKNLLIEVIQDSNEIILSTTSASKYIRGKIIKVGDGYITDSSIKYNLNRFIEDDVVWFNMNAASNIYISGKKLILLDADQVILKENIHE